MQVPKILKVKDPDTVKDKPLHPHLPQPPACVLLCSPIRTGKSTLISNMLLNPAFYGPEFFDSVKIISSTINNDLTSRFLKEHFDVEDHYDDLGDDLSGLGDDLAYLMADLHTGGKPGFRRLYG